MSSSVTLSSNGHVLTSTMSIKFSRVALAPGGQKSTQVR